MAESRQVPPGISNIDGDSPFAFHCHQRLSCFTECCRMLELTLSPYDVLRLRRGTGLTSAELLEKHIIIEQDRGEPLPRLYLSMVDDGRESCVFIGKNGCSVYPHRPGACRTFPLGRGVRCESGGISEHYVLIREPFCQGFDEQRNHTPRQYLLDQEVVEYHRYNDRFAEILQHRAIRNGHIPSPSDVKLFLLLLFDLDTLRTTLRQEKLPEAALSPGDMTKLDCDEVLLDFAFDLLPRLIFPASGVSSMQHAATSESLARCRQNLDDKHCSCVPRQHSLPSEK